MRPQLKIGKIFDYRCYLNSLITLDEKQPGIYIIIRTAVIYDFQSNIET